MSAHFVTSAELASNSFLRAASFSLAADAIFGKCALTRCCDPKTGGLHNEARLEFDFSYFARACLPARCRARHYGVGRTVQKNPKLASAVFLSKAKLLGKLRLGYLTQVKTDTNIGVAFGRNCFGNIGVLYHNLCQTANFICIPYSTLLYLVIAIKLWQRSVARGFLPCSRLTC